MDGHYIGIDVGSVSTNLVIIDENDNVIEKLYLRTKGQPINTLIKGMQLLADKFSKKIHVKGVGTTGSGRQLASIIVGTDTVKNGIKAHAVAAGTGSFLDRQAGRLEMPIEAFGGYALRSKSPVRIAGRCAVFAESDMIHKQQTAAV